MGDWTIVAASTEAKNHDEASDIDYFLLGDYYIPDIELQEDDNCPIWKWG